MMNNNNPNNHYTSADLKAKVENKVDDKKEEAASFYEDTKDKVQDMYQQGKEKVEDVYEQSKDHAEKLYGQAKDSASDLYEGSKQKLHDAQDCLHDYSDELVKTVKAKPMTSLLVAGGIGFLLSALLRK